MSKELMIERIEKAQKEIEAKREKIQQGKFRQNYHFKIGRASCRERV